MNITNELPAINFYIHEELTPSQKFVERYYMWISISRPSKWGKNLPLLGSWTAFWRMYSEKEHEYLPMIIIIQPPKYDICNNLLDGLSKITDNFQLSHLSVHDDEEIYYRLGQILWKHDNVYKTIFIIVGGFYQFCIRRNRFFKRHGCLEYKGWFVESCVKAQASIRKYFVFTIITDNETFKMIIWRFSAVLYGPSYVKLC